MILFAFRKSWRAAKFSGPACPICRSPKSSPFKIVEGLTYFECAGCESIFVEPDILRAIEEGHFVRPYDEAYWASEDRAAWWRSYGPSLARVAEVFLCARRPIRRFLDVGCGPGYLLDALATYLPASKDLFWGVELFPPERHSAHPHYVRGGVADLEGVFDAGICMEVVEHMTPTQVRSLAKDLAAVSAPDSLYIINTGMPAFVKTTAPDYLDPYQRGHIVSYSVKGLEALFAPEGFATHKLAGKDWACLIEFRPTQTERKSVANRIWNPEPSNARALHDPQMGELLYVLGLDTARAYR